MPISSALNCSSGVKREVCETLPQRPSPDKVLNRDSPHGHPWAIAFLFCGKRYFSNDKHISYFSIALC
jgi:hypothetical protein